jgi:hypothetical protein
MVKVQLIVELEIDDSLEPIEDILSEMDYKFTFKSDWEYEKELITKTEILERIS